MVLGDTPLDVLVFYVVLYVTYGRTYVKVAQTMVSPFKEAKGKAILRGDWFAHRGG